MTLKIDAIILIKLDISKRFIQNAGIENIPVDNANKKERNIKMNRSLIS
jgi:hypothetical protein